MNEKDNYISSGHDYDGIREYDNPSPVWWNWMLYLSVVYSFWYLGYYSGMGAALAPVQKEEAVTAWSTGLYHLQSKRQEALFEKTRQKPLEGEALTAFLQSPESIEKGREVYVTNCAVCHGDQGQGLVGPNLVDEYWLHGRHADDIIKSISEGFPEKGMEPWKAKIGMRNIYQLTAYIQNIEGKQVPNPKEPQGQKK